MSLTLSLEQLRRGGAPRLRAERAVDLATSLALLPIAVKVALPATADANAVKLELIQLLDNRIGTFDLMGAHAVGDGVLTVKLFATAARGGVAHVDALLQQRGFTLLSPSTGAELSVTATQCQPSGMLLPLGTTELIIHHMANADNVAGVTRALLLASGYSDSDFQVLTEMLGGARLPAHLQTVHGNTTVVRAIVRMEDPAHGLCPRVRDIDRGAHTGPITVTATFSGDRDILITPPRQSHHQQHPPPPQPPSPPPPAAATTRAPDVASRRAPSRATETPATAPSDGGASPMSDTEAPPGDDGGAHDADHPMLDSDSTDTASVADDQPPPPAQRRRTGDLLGPMGPMGPAAADADPPIQVFPQMTPAPATDAGVAAMETDLATLDGSARAARQVSSYAAVHSRLRAPTAASTLGRIGASPTWLHGRLHSCPQPYSGTSAASTAVRRSSRTGPHHPALRDGA